MYFLTSLRIIQLTFLFHDELNVRDRRVLKEITVDLDIDFSLRKIVIGEVIGKKICLTDEAIRNTMKRCDGLKKCCIVQNLKEKLITYHMFSLYHFQRGLQTRCYDLQKVNEVKSCLV